MHECQHIWLQSKFKISNNNRFLNKPWCRQVKVVCCWTHLLALSSHLPDLHWTHDCQSNAHNFRGYVVKQNLRHLVIIVWAMKIIDQTKTRWMKGEQACYICLAVSLPWNFNILHCWLVSINGHGQISKLSIRRSVKITRQSANCLPTVGARTIRQWGQVQKRVFLHFEQFKKSCAIRKIMKKKCYKLPK